MSKAGYYVAAFVMDLLLGLVLFAVPLFAKNALGADPLQIGVVGMSGTLGYVFACTFCGTMSERVGRKPMILWGVVFFAIVYALISQSRALWQLDLLMVCGGVSMGMFWPALEAGIAEDTPRRSLGLRIGFFNIAWSGGIAAGAAIGGPVYDYGKLTEHGARFPFYCAVAVCPLLFLLVLLIVPRRRTAVTVPAGEADTPAVVPPGAAVSTYRLMAWVANFSSWTVLSVMRYLFAADVERRLAFSGKLAGFMIGSISAAQVVMFIFLMCTTFWHYNLVFFLAGQASAATGAAVVCLGRSPAVLFAGFCLIGLGVGVTYCSSIYYSLEGSRQMGSHAGIHETVLGLGVLLGPLVGGWLVRVSGDDRTAYAFCVLFVAIAVTVELAIRRRRSEELGARS